MSLPAPHPPDRSDLPKVDRPQIGGASDDRPRVERLEVVRSDRQQVRREAEVYRVTSAKKSLSEEQRFRTKRYLISMGIRTVCFLAAVFSQGWLRWAFLVGALILPYVAVIMANAGRENDPFTGPEPVDDVDVRQLPERQPGTDT